MALAKNPGFGFEDPGFGFETSFLLKILRILAKNAIFLKF
jgi:hypothetical protein